MATLASPASLPAGGVGCIGSTEKLHREHWQHSKHARPAPYHYKHYTPASANISVFSSFFHNKPRSMKHEETALAGL